MAIFKPKFNRHEAETIPSEEEVMEEEFVDDEVPTPQPIQKKQVVKPTVQPAKEKNVIIEREVNLSLLNEKLNYIISKIEQ